MKTKAVSGSLLEMNAIPVSFPEKAPPWAPQVLLVPFSCTALPACRKHQVTPSFTGRNVLSVGEAGVLANSFPPDRDFWQQFGPGRPPAPARQQTGPQPGSLRARPFLPEVMIGPTGPVLVTSACQTCAQHLQMALTYG